MLTVLVQEPTIPRSDIIPIVDISVKTLKNPNEHIFAIRNHHEKRFDYQKIKFMKCLILLEGTLTNEPIWKTYSKLINKKL